MRPYNVTWRAELRWSGVEAFTQCQKLYTHKYIGMPKLVTCRLLVRHVMSEQMFSHLKQKKPSWYLAYHHRSPISWADWGRLWVRWHFRSPCCALEDAGWLTSCNSVRMGELLLRRGLIAHWPVWPSHISPEKDWECSEARRQIILSSTVNKPRTLILRTERSTCRPRVINLGSRTSN